MDWQFKVGLGAAVIFGLLPFAVKDMPHWVTWPGISVGMLFLVWGFIPRHDDFPLIPTIVFIACVVGCVASATWGIENSKPKEYDTPIVYAQPTTRDGKLETLRAVIGARGVARQHNVGFELIAVTKDKPMKQGRVFAPFIDPDTSTATNIDLDIGEYIIMMRADSGLFRETLTTTLVDGQVQQSIRILNDQDVEIFKMNSP